MGMNFCDQIRGDRLQTKGEKVMDKGQLEDYGCICTRIWSRGDQRGYTRIKWKVAWATNKLFLHCFQPKVEEESKSHRLSSRFCVFLDQRRGGKKTTQSFSTLLFISTHIIHARVMDQPKLTTTGEMVFDVFSQWKPCISLFF